MRGQRKECTVPPDVSSQTVVILLPNGTRVCLPAEDHNVLRAGIQAAAALNFTSTVSSKVLLIANAAPQQPEYRMLAERLGRIESALLGLVKQRRAQEWYDTAAAGDILGRAAYSVREWCRLGRVRAEKRACGRGRSKEWMIAHEELMRIKAEGLLPLRPSASR
jgi:hypothetical protein